MIATALDWWSYAITTLWRVLAILNQGFREFQDANTAVVIVGRRYSLGAIYLGNDCHSFGLVELQLQ